MNNLQANFEQILADDDLSMLEFCNITGFNFFELENLFAKRLISVSDPAVIRLANALGCEVAELFEHNNELPANSDEISEDMYQKLLANFSGIDLELFFESVAKVDEIITTEGKDISSQDKAKAYLAFYELADRLLDSK